MLPGLEELKVRNGTDRESAIMLAMYDALSTADKLLGVYIRKPFQPSSRIHDEWMITHAMVKTICKFYNNTSRQPRGFQA